MSDPLREGLSLLAAELGRPVSTALLGDGMPLDGGRLPLAQVRKAMRRAGLSARAVAMPVEQAPTSLLPALLIMRDGQTRLMVGRDEEAAILLSAETGGGRERVPIDVLRVWHEGTIVFARPLYEGDSRAGAYAKGAPRHWLRSVVGDAWPAFAEVGVAATFANLLAIATSLFSMQVYDRVVPTSNIIPGRTSVRTTGV